MTKSLLEINLNCIKSYNPALANQIASINSLKSGITLCETEAAEPNLVYNGIPLHNSANAELEAKNIFQKVEKSPLKIQIVFGLGLGYLFKEVCEGAKGPVILFEPDIEILRAVFEIVDFSDVLSKNDVYVSCDLKTFNLAISKAYTYNSNAEILILPSYRSIYSEMLNDYVNQLNMAVGACIINLGFMKRRSYLSVKSLYSNIYALTTQPPLNLFKDIYKGCTAVVVAGGPSLDNSINELKKYKDNAVIITVGQAARTLINNGIKPDFFVSVELCNILPQIEGLDLSGINLILEPFTHYDCHKIKNCNKISYPSQNSHSNIIWSLLSGVNTEGYVSGGTVSYTALESAKIMGFNEIIMVGLDLAYPEGRCYTRGSRNNDLICDKNPETGKIEVRAVDFEHFVQSFVPFSINCSIEKRREIAMNRLDFMNKSLLHVKSVTGEMIPTEAAFASFIGVFKQFAATHKQLKLYNASKIGAQIDGFENISVEKLLSNKKPCKKLELKSDFKLSADKISKNLVTVKSVLEEANSCITDMIKTCEDYSQEPSLQKFKQIVVSYLSFRDKYCEKNLTFKYIELSESMQIGYLMKKHVDVDEKAVQEIFNAIKNYFTVLQNRIITINNQIGKQYEMLNTKG